MATSKVEIDQDSFTPALDRVAASLDDMTPLYRDLGEYLLESTRQNFREGSAPDGTAWLPKSMTTMEAYRRREAKGLNGPVSAAPLIGPSKALSTTISYEARTDGVDWGSNMIYAAVMQFGASKGAFGTAANDTPIPWGDIPARPFIGLGPDDNSAILTLIEEYLEDAADG